MVPPLFLINATLLKKSAGGGGLYGLRPPHLKVSNGC